MKRVLLILAVLALSAGPTAAQQLEFKDGKFKVIQFTDLHIRTTLKTEAKDVYDFMDKAIRQEKPDMIVITDVNPERKSVQRHSFPPQPYGRLPSGFRGVDQ